MSPGFWRFYDAVATKQVKEWLEAAPPGLVLDLSAAGGRFGQLAAQAGHHVLHVCELPDRTLHEAGVQPVAADTFDLGWLRDGAVDAILAESGALSEHLAAEHTFGQLHRVLKPGGRLLMCVDSLVLGLARLAEQGRWAELADVPSADVVLIPNEDGSISRCFWPEELHQVLTDFGYDVDWVRPRTVLSQEAVTRALDANPGSLDTLVATEVALAKEREGESTGIHLLAAARRR
ncbi:MAG TPA: class I SAM-dependent methyltransferase [Mycobacteriales bacterium]|nr:class I SAM-dependent methyltransferase [Mycobacteriales bacterium]